MATGRTVAHSAAHHRIRCAHQARYQRGTKDSDVLHASDLLDDVRRRLLELAGPGTELHTRHRLYIDIVANGVPFLPHVPRWHLVTSLASLVSFEVTALDVVDVVVSKLKRFNANDISDIEAMIDDQLVSRERLLERFRDAVDCFSGDARAEDLPKIRGEPASRRARRLRRRRDRDRAAELDLRREDVIEDQRLHRGRFDRAVGDERRFTRHEERAVVGAIGQAAV